MRLECRSVITLRSHTFRVDVKPNQNTNEINKWNERHTYSVLLGCSTQIAQSESL